MLVAFYDIHGRKGELRGVYVCMYVYFKLMTHYLVVLIKGEVNSTSAYTKLAIFINKFSSTRRIWYMPYKAKTYPC
jgi:hypothetical protein